MRFHGSAVTSMLVCCAVFALSACSTAGYYWQAIEGHFDVQRRAVPFAQAVESAANADLAQRLARAREIRDFASRELGLPDNGSYRRYADVGRPYVIWNVFAAPALSVRPAESCFPVAGCVPYRGYYKEADARAHADELAASGLDVYVGGVLAYSTLGWFDDPVLSTFIGLPGAEFARIIFHELAHQMLYVRGDAQFNESFAVALEQVGVRRWLASRGDAAAVEEMRRWEEGQVRRQAFFALLVRYRDRLARLYESAVPEDEKRMGKAQSFAALIEEYQALKLKWGGFAGYDRLFAQRPNNALLASVAIYTDHVPFFVSLIEKYVGNLTPFYVEVRRLAALSRDERLAVMAAATGSINH